MSVTTHLLHRVKAGLAQGEPRSLDETVTESEDESKHLSSASGLLLDKQGSVTSDTDVTKGPSVTVTEDSSSYAVKKRLAMRLSRGKQVGVCPNIRIIVDEIKVKYQNQLVCPTATTNYCGWITNGRPTMR